MIEGRHTGKNIASILTRTVERYELHGKVKEYLSPQLPSDPSHNDARLGGLPVMALQ
jgi:hypothetical protein